MSTFEEAESDDSREGWFITMLLAAKVKSSLIGRVPGVDEIRPEKLKVLGVMDPL